jgi:hypothetical protein
VARGVSQRRLVPKGRLGAECERQRGTAPARVPPPRGLRWGVQQGGQRALDPRHQDGGADGGRSLAVSVHGAAQWLGVLKADETVPTGVRAEQHGSNLRRRAASGT